jgi:MFS family permease
MLDPRVFARRALSAGSLSIFVQFFAFYGFIFLILQYLQIIRGDSALIAAVSMLPMAATMMPTARLAPAVAARIGSRQMCVAGLLLIAAALAIIAHVSQTSPYWLLVAGLLILGVGMGCAMTPATTNITAALPAQKQGVASAINDLSREVGGAIGIAVIGSIMTAIYRSHRASRPPCSARPRTRSPSPRTSAVRSRPRPTPRSSTVSTSPCTPPPVPPPWPRSWSS